MMRSIDTKMSLPLNAVEFNKDTEYRIYFLYIYAQHPFAEFNI